MQDKFIRCGQYSLHNLIWITSTSCQQATPSRRYFLVNAARFVVSKWWRPRDMTVTVAPCKRRNGLLTGSASTAVEDAARRLVLWPRQDCGDNNGNAGKLREKWRVSRVEPRASSLTPARLPASKSSLLTLRSHLPLSAGHSWTGEGNIEADGPAL